MQRIALHSPLLRHAPCLLVSRRIPCTTGAAQPPVPLKHPDTYLADVSIARLNLQGGALTGASLVGLLLTDDFILVLAND